MSDIPQLPFFLNQKEFIGITGYLHGNRRVLISGELNNDSLKKTTLELIKLEYDEVAPILIVIESGGGQMTPSLQFADTISMLNSPIDIVTIGDCTSMAVDIVQMCRKRYMLPSSRLLVHYIRNLQPWIFDDPERLETDIRYFHERLVESREFRFSLYEKRTGLPRTKLEEMFRHGEVHGAYFSAKQAIEHGLADEILTDFKFLPIKDVK